VYSRHQIGTVNAGQHKAWRCNIRKAQPPLRISTLQEFHFAAAQRAGAVVEKLYGLVTVFPVHVDKSQAFLIPYRSIERAAFCFTPCLRSSTLRTHSDELPVFLQERRSAMPCEHTFLHRAPRREFTMTFDDLGLSTELLTAISKMGFETPTPVQAQVIPRLLKNKGDVVALAQTGTGKTAAFGLPILSMLDHDNRSPQALILCPTRELCVQISRDLKAFAACSPAVKTVAVYGGSPIHTQLRALERGVQIIVATPGRMLDILRRQKADLTGVKRVILDEADEMLNMGFQEDLEAILTEVPESAHTLLFSATMPRYVANIAKKYMSDAEEITVGQRNAGAETVNHECYVVHQRDRYVALKRIADSFPTMYAIIFCRTRQDTQNVADWLLRDGYNVDSLHGDLSQIQRDRVMEKFRARTLQLLVATDVAARGLDVNDLTHVINYNIPEDPGSYTHRSGRTGRAGKTGTSILIINMREKGKAHRIEKLIGKRFAYRDVPSPRDICKAQLLRLVSRIKDVEVSHAEIDPYLPDILKSVEGLEREDLVTRFLSLEFNSLLAYYQNAQKLLPSGYEKRGRDSRPDRKGGKDARGSRERKLPPQKLLVRMFVNLGRMDGMNPSRLTGLICREGGHDIPIGRIDIMRKHSFFDVAPKDVQSIMVSLGMATYHGKDVRVETDDSKSPDKRHRHPERRKPTHHDKSERYGRHTKPGKASSGKRGPGPGGPSKGPKKPKKRKQPKKKK